MQLLNRLRDEESEIEQRRLKPFVQTYGLLATYYVRVTKEEQDSVDALSVKEYALGEDVFGLTRAPDRSCRPSTASSAC